MFPAKQKSSDQRPNGPPGLFTGSEVRAEGFRRPFDGGVNVLFFGSSFVTSVPPKKGSIRPGFHQRRRREMNGMMGMRDANTGF